MNAETKRFTAPKDEPLAILRSALDQEWAQSQAVIVSGPGESTEDQDRPYDLVGDAAVIEVRGPLMQRGGWWFDGYESILSRFAYAMQDSAVSRVVLKIDSPGGTVRGMFDACRAMRAMADASGKRVIAYADEVACSAAYALSCVADEICLPETGCVGSIGIIAVAYSFAKQLEKEGVDVRIVTSGSQKADLNPMAPLDSAAVSRLQSEVNTLAEMFAGWVSERRAGLTPQAVLGYEAGVFRGKEGVSAKLADRVTSWMALSGELQTPRTDSTNPPPPISSSAPPPQDSPRGVYGAVCAPTGVKMDPETLALLGLKADASPEEIAKAVASAVRGTSTVAAATGTTDPARQAGTIEALRAQAEQGRAAQAELAALKAKQAERDAAARTARLDAAVKSMRLSPAAKERFAALSPEAFDSAMDALEANAPIVSSTPAVPDSDAVRAAASNSADSLVAEQLSLTPQRMAAARSNHTPGATVRYLGSVLDEPKAQERPAIRRMA